MQREHYRYAGLESGIEAAIHSVMKSFQDQNSECLLVDADNAFNILNRKVSLENIRRLTTHAHLPTQQLQHSRRAISGKWAHIMS